MLGENRRRRVLFRWWHRQPDGGAHTGTRGRGAVLRQPACPADVGKIKAPLQIHYAEDDERINKGWPAYESALKAHNVRYEMHMYPKTQHAFHNDTTPRYDEAAAKLSWQRTVDFFNKHLRS
jgi:carboxymethylenebutenolidase